MGAQRVLQAAVVAVALIAHAAVAVGAPAGKGRRERVAVVDLGPPGPGEAEVRRQLAAAVVAAGFEAVVGDGVEDALAGEVADQDAVELAAAIAEAQRQFGALDCPAATAAARRAVGIAAARQAAGLPAPELARAWTYVLLCADRANDLDAALAAAARLRAVGGSADVPADVWRKYPEVDAAPGGDRVDLEIVADVPGAAIWIDHERAGTSPLAVSLSPGEHVIAAAARGRRGWAAGAAVRAQARLEVPTADRSSAWSEVGRRVASWSGAVPPPEELGWVLARVHARAALIRRGDTVEAWGRSGLAEKPHRLGGDDGIAPAAEAARMLGLIADRVSTWDDHAPDPDQPLLVEDRRGGEARRREQPTKWWVYAAIIGAVSASAAIVLAHEVGSDRQRVELHYP
jgi:hypothetical protein